MSLKRVGFDSAKFLIIFGVVALVASFALQYVSVLNFVAAGSTQAVLGALGRPSVLQTDASGLPHLFFEKGVVAAGAVDAEFNDLCAGKIELAVLLGIIVASIDRKRRARALGFVLGALLFFLFNPLRAAFTLLFAGSAWLGIIHDVFFRVSLVFIIVVYYALWYSWLSHKNFFCKEGTKCL